MRYTLVLASFVAVLAVPCALFGAPLYVEDFDTDHTANWTTNNNANGTNAANYFFDYSTVGIPSAPHSTGGSTLGLKLQANISGTGPASGNLPGISVSPTGQSFTGDYAIRFDWWHNFIGGTTSGIGNAAGGSGSTQLSEFGLLSSGTSANFVGASDGLFFAADGDGASSADYRVYSSEKPASYQIGDAHNVYAAGSRDSANAYYQALFPAGNTAPLIQQTTFPATQTGSTLAGVAGFKWHDVVIQKVGTTVTWTVDGTLMATTSNIDQFTTATSGTNILFGHGDTSLGAGTPAATFQAVDFTLIDNVRVVVPEPSTVVLCGIAVLGLFALRRQK